MQHGPQRSVGVLAIVEVKLLGGCLEPKVGLLNSMIQSGDA
jgi:hypothetical protein